MTVGESLGRCQALFSAMMRRCSSSSLLGDTKRTGNAGGCCNEPHPGNPDSVQEALRLPAGQQAAELLKELAVALYARSALSFSKACELSKIDRLEFGRLLARREVPRHCGEEELERDWQYASGE